VWTEFQEEILIETKEFKITFGIEFFYLYVLILFDIVQHIDLIDQYMHVNQHIYDEDHYEMLKKH
jgi:hypothetical protein